MSNNGSNNRSSGTGPPPPLDPNMSHMMQQRGGQMQGGQYPPQQYRHSQSSRQQMMMQQGGSRGMPPGAQRGMMPRGAQYAVRWQDPHRDNQIRREMIGQIVHLLKDSKHNGSKEFLQKLPNMAKRLEDKLYRYARSEADYTDRSTLRQRLQKIAMQISQTTQNPAQGPPGAVGRGMPGRGRDPSMYNGAARGAPAARGRGRAVARATGGPPPTANMRQNMMAQQPVPKGRAKKVASGGAGRGAKKAAAAAAAAAQQAAAQQARMPMNQANMAAQQQAQMRRGQYAGMPQQPRTNQQSREAVLKQQQHRLLLLRHASKCQSKEGECRATPLCAQYKQLWQHIAKCKDQRCETAHCVSSRYVLSHYHKCQDQACAVCGPVREAIDRHNRQRLERTKGMQNDPRSAHMARGGVGGPPPIGAMGRQPSNPAMMGQMPMHQGRPVPAHGQRMPPQQMGMNPMDDNMQGQKAGKGRGRGRKKKEMVQPPPAGMSQDAIAQQQLLRQLQEAQERARLEAQKAAALQRQIEQLSNQRAGGAAPMPVRQPPPQMQQPVPVQPPPQPAIPNPKPLQRSGSTGSRGGRSKGRGKATTKRKQSAASTASKSEPPVKQAKTSSAKGRGAARGAKSTGGLPAVPAKASSGGRARGGRGTVATGYPPQVGANGQAPATAVKAEGRGVSPKGPPPKPGQVPPAQRGRDWRPPNLPESQALRSQSSLINTFTRDEIKAHIGSLVVHSSQIKMKEWRKEAAIILKTLKEQTYYWIFSKPVDPIQFNIPDYFDVIKHPMDLGTVQKKLDKGEYRQLRDFAADVRLTFNNAIFYNPESSDVNITSKKYAQLFEKQYNNLLQNMRADEALKRQNENACRLCGGEKYIFEPPVYYCNGKCNQKIRRNAWYYTTPDNKHYYCSVCFQAWKKDTVELEDGSVIKKDELKKQKNMEVQEESWVQCNFCNRWYHQICALFNGKRNERSKNEDYHCAMCILRHMDNNGVDRLEPKYQPPRSNAGKDLPKTKFSNYLEERIQKRVLEARKEYATSKGVTVDDVEKPGELCVRVVSCRDTDMFPRQGLERLYKGPPTNYPRSFPHRVKCVLLFERIDGVDVLIFGMYIQSYGSECPEPNKRCLYVSYLDSVFYFQPRYLRTPVYHELLSATLAYERKLGITKAFIWACPPLSGDDYILYCHPKDQKTPKAEMLRNWYLRLLERSRKENIVVSLDNLYDAYIIRTPTPCGIPNFDGDYWPGCTENYIEELEREKTDPKSVAPRAKRAYNKNKGHSKKNSKSKSKGNKQKKKSKKNKYRKKAPDGKDKGKDEENAVISKFTPPTPLPLIELPQQDALTVKIGATINQMKDDFIVVRMHHVCAGCSGDINKPHQVYWLPKEWEPSDIDLDYTKNRYAPPYALCNDCYQKDYQKQYGKKSSEKIPPKGTISLYKKNIKKETKSNVKVKKEAVQVKKETVVKTEKNNSTGAPPPPPPGAPPGNAVKQEQDAEEKEEPEEITTILPEGKTAKLRNSWTEAPCTLQEMYPLRTDIAEKTVDNDPMMDCEFFDTRQQFLSLCQGNKYQFDELRRAKHTSMMVLYHLHNPKLDAFVTSCNACSATISGNRYTCKKCDYDLCEKCHANPKIKHPHPLQITGSAAANKARKQKVNDKKALLVHAVSCREVKCKANKLCPKMKAFLKHGRECEKRVRGGCKICLKISVLLQLHSRHCTLPTGKCMVPNCAKTKELMRRHAAMQQDRRIRMQNQRMIAERQAAKQAANANGNTAPNTPQSASTPTQKPGHNTKGKYSKKNSKNKGKNKA